MGSRHATKVSISFKTDVVIWRNSLNSDHDYLPAGNGGFYKKIMFLQGIYNLMRFVTH